jgi:hypothetical protein
VRALRVYRGRNSRVASIYAMLCAITGALSAISTIVGGRLAIGIAVIVVSVAMFLYGLLVLWRVGVIIDDRVVTLRGAYGTRRIARTRVDHFEIAPTYPWRVWLVLRDGSRIRTTGVGPSGVRHRTSLAASQEMVDELNEVVAS